VDLREASDKEQVPDYLVNFSIELSIVQRKFNLVIDGMIECAKAAMQPLLVASSLQIQEVLEKGQQRGLWSYTIQDYERSEVRKAVAALLTKEKAVQEQLELWGRKVETIEQVPDSLANMAVEACYADSKALASAA